MNEKIKLTIENLKHRITIERIDNAESIDFKEVIDLVDKVFESLGYEI